MEQNIFKAYDIRGLYPQEINELDVYKIARAYCEFLKPREVAIGCDVRVSSPALKRAALKAVTDSGVRVIDIGTISTDMLYFAVGHYGYAGGFSITASHNPKEYNGIKFVREKSAPISSDTGLFEIRDIAQKVVADESVLTAEPDPGLIETKDIWKDYIRKIRTMADFSRLKKMKVVMNANFGMAGIAAEKLLANTPIEIIKLNFEPDGNFPKGRPDPLIPSNREEISKLVVDSGADMGVAWDADADRCFFFTEKGEFIEGYFITALLGEIFLKRFPGSKIVHDPRLIWTIQDVAKTFGGTSIISRVGHSFIKEIMKKEDAVFGGEMSAHYYFRDYFYADCGMIPLAMMLEFVSSQSKPLSEIMQSMFWSKYFVSGEINNQVADVASTIRKIEEHYTQPGFKIDKLDGLSVESPEWRFNVRGSNTEPVIRLNVEARSDAVMQELRDQLLAMIRQG